MGSTTFHRNDIDIVSGDGATKSAELTIEDSGGVTVKVTKLDGSATNADTPVRTDGVYIRMPSSGESFNLKFLLPNNVTKATYEIDGQQYPLTTKIPPDREASFDVHAIMVDKPVTCTLAWSDVEGSVTITVRPRSSTGPSGGVVSP
jgi:hypothetical protein